MNNKFKNVTLTASMMEYVTKVPHGGTAANLIVIQQLFTTAVNMSTVIQIAVIS